MLPEHKNPIFVSKRPKISEKSPILTQKCRFCARKARNRGFRRSKAHKNPDFVLGRLSLCAEYRATARRQPEKDLRQTKHTADNQKKTVGNQKKTAGNQNTPAIHQRPTAWYQKGLPEPRDGLPADLYANTVYCGLL